MVCEYTLRIKHLPKELSNAEKEEFLRHFGAIKVKIITSKIKQQSVVYAKFESKEIAKNVMFRLHQLVILTSRLCVEYAEQDLGVPRIKRIEETNQNNNSNLKAFVNRLNAFNHSVDFYQPPPPHLKYKYPKANRPTINNIGHALATVPKFYVQVLHLMNKMNLPPPFAVPEPARQQIMQQQQQVQQQRNSPTVTGTSTKAQSESESELESDEDKATPKEIIPQKRKLVQKKVIKRPKFIKPNPPQTNPTKTEANSEDVFEKTDLSVQRKIEMKMPTGINPSTSSENGKVIGVIGVKPDDETTEITDEDLATNQIPSSDLHVVPVFKNYHPGIPTNRLYIKNIAKNVDVRDLELIYNRYKLTNSGTEETSTTSSPFEIKLMQEGRMKGQAFITLDSVEIAQKALNETNAYKLKDKPLVVVFAKTAVTKK